MGVVKIMFFPRDSSIIQCVWNYMMKGACLDGNLWSALWHGWYRKPNSKYHRCTAPIPYRYASTLHLLNLDGNDFHISYISSYQNIHLVLLAKLPRTAKLKMMKSLLEIVMQMRWNKFLYRCWETQLLSCESFREVQNSHESLQRSQLSLHRSFPVSTKSSAH